MYSLRSPSFLGSPDLPSAGVASASPIAPDLAAASTGETLVALNPTSPAPVLDPSRTKTLPPSVVKDIEQKNIARRLAGLSAITIKVRRCIACGSPFESAGNRTCGCSSRTAGTIAGREII